MEGIKKKQMGKKKSFEGEKSKENRDKREIFKERGQEKGKQKRESAKAGENKTKGDFRRKSENEGRAGDAVKSIAGKKEAKDSCPYYRKCGGCQGQREAYSVHLHRKQKNLEELLGKFCHLDPIIGMKEPYHYRNKVHAVFDHDRKGNPICGVYEENTHNVIPVENCRIEDKRAAAIIITIRDLLKSFRIRTYDEDNGTGLLRHVLIRTGYASGEIMVVLVLSTPILPSKNNFVKALLKVHPEISTIVINVNGKNTSMVLGDKEQVIYGKGFIEDTLCKKIFRISPRSFYQVNPVQTEILYKKAVKFAGLTGKETVLDAYCGIGTIGIIAAGQARQVLGVELNKDAVKDAVSNAKRNSADNIRFYQNDAGEFMEQVAQADDLKVDVVFMDPPRSGSNEKFMDALAHMKPGKVVYISCNPITLEKDLLYLQRKGFRVEKGGGVDLFPWTGHVETIVGLHRRDT